MILKWAFPAVVLVLIVAKSGSADTTLNYVDQASGRGSVQIAIHKHKTFITDLRGKRINAIYNAQGNTLILLDRQRKTYTVLGHDARQRLQKLVQAVSGVQRSLSQLFTGAAPQTKHLRIKATGRTAKSGTHQCDVLDARMNSQLMAEICVAPAKSLDISAADAATLETLGTTMRDLLGGLTPYLTVDGATDFLARGKLPFRVSHAEHGQTYIDVLKTVSSKTLSSTLFSVPKGYRQRSLTTEILNLSHGS